MDRLCTLWGNCKRQRGFWAIKIKKKERKITKPHHIRSSTKAYFRIHQTYLTVGIETTSAHARIHTAIVFALQITTTIDIVQTFATIAVCQRIAAMPRWAGTDGATGSILTNSIYTTRIATAAIG